MGGLLRCFLPTKSTSYPAFCKARHDLLTLWSVTKSLITDTIARFIGAKNYAIAPISYKYSGAKSAPFSHSIVLNRMENRLK